MRSLHILLAEDDPRVSKVTRLILEKAGHTLQFAVDGREALRSVEETDFDLLILDQLMPFHSGEEVAAIVSAKKPELPIILLTGQVNLGADQPMGVNLVLRKPVGVQALLNALQQLAGSN